MTDPTAGPTPAEVDADGVAPAQETVPDYTRVGFRDLQRLCKARGLSGEGKAADLVERLRAQDEAKGQSVDLSALDSLPDDDDEIDLLADDEPEPAGPPADGAAASEPSAGPVEATQQPATATSAAPAMDIRADPDVPPPARGRAPDLTTDGIVKVGQGFGAAAAYGYQMAYPVGPYEISDLEHFRMIADTHAAAQVAGHTTRGGATVGERIGFGADANGRRTAIYRVAVKRK